MAKPLKFSRSDVKAIAKNMANGKKKTKWPVEATADKPKTKKAEKPVDFSGPGATKSILLRVTEVRTFYVDEHTTSERGEKYYHICKANSLEGAMAIAKMVKKAHRTANIQIPCKLEFHPLAPLEPERPDKPKRKKLKTK